MKSLTEVYLYKQLKRIFGEENLRVFFHTPENPEFTYVPVRNGIENLGWIGIYNHKLTEETKQLLQLLMEAPSLMQATEKKEEAFWSKALQQEMSEWLAVWNELGYAEDTEIGLIYIMLDQKEQWDTDIYEQFQEMIEGVMEEDSFLLPLKEGYFLWLLPDYACVCHDIEPLLKGLVDTLASELMLKTQFFIDTPIKMPLELREHVQSQFKIVQACERMNLRKNVLHIHEIIHLYFIKQTPASERRKYVTKILGPVINDTEVLETVRAYFKENLNLSEAAKKLFIHRNSMQYRLDKFSEKTGYDPRNYDHSVIIYIAIQALGMLNKD